jgi:hypothetical protein
MSERSLEYYENISPLVYIAIATVATFSSVAMLMWLLTLFVIFP